LLFPRESHRETNLGGASKRNPSPVIAVEPADCLTVGGAMTPAVQEAVPIVVKLVQRLVSQPRLDRTSLEAARSVA
jgi:hypothetical protein